MLGLHCAARGGGDNQQTSSCAPAAGSISRLMHMRPVLLVSLPASTEQGLFDRPLRSGRMCCCLQYHTFACQVNELCHHVTAWVGDQGANAAARCREAWREPVSFLTLLIVLMRGSSARVDALYLTRRSAHCLTPALPTHVQC